MLQTESPLKRQGRFQGGLSVVWCSLRLRARHKRLTGGLQLGLGHAQAAPRLRRHGLSIPTIYLIAKSGPHM